MIEGMDEVVNILKVDGTLVPIDVEARVAGFWGE